jgi:hypothetical protein
MAPAEIENTETAMRTAARSCLILPLILAGAPAARGATTNWAFRAELTVRETFDSNVYLQDVEPLPANVAAAKAAGFTPVTANQESFVSSVLPKLGLDYQASPACKLALGYAPEMAYYYSAHSEHYTTHRGTLNFGGQAEGATWELANTATYIDGSKTGPVFARPEDIPALGGIPLRDRRAAFVYRNGFKLTEPIGNWFLRPVATTYIHDFKTDQVFIPPATRASYTYENYIDRRDVNGGLDAGYQVADGFHIVGGYRYGQQDQFKAPLPTTGAVVDSPYDSAYHRVLVGAEGMAASWLKLSVLAGPDLRTWNDPIGLRQLAPGFDQNELLWYWDMSATIQAGSVDTVTLKSTRFEQPAFSSFSMYEDIKTVLLWRHRFGGKFAATLGFTLYIGDWQAPVNRDDWIYTPNAALTWTLSKHFSAEAAYSYDWVDSKVPANVEPLTESHEYTRHLVSLSAKYTF